MRLIFIFTKLVLYYSLVIPWRQFKYDKYLDSILDALDSLRAYQKYYFKEKITQAKNNLLNKAKHIFNVNYQSIF